MYMCEYNIETLQNRITSVIIQSLEQKQRPWIQSWDQMERSIPYNLVSGDDYSWINVLLLWLAAKARQYPHHGWLTLSQATQAGYEIVKGEQGMICFKFEVETATNEKTGKTFQKAIPKVFEVFNVDQVKQVKEFGQESVTHENPDLTTPIEKCQELIRVTDVYIKHDRTFVYSDDDDVITVPKESDFKDKNDYYANVLHNLILWTGHESRLKRNTKLKSEAAQYKKDVFESLIADLGAAFLCAKFKLRGKWQLADSTIDQWIPLLRKDNDAIFRAALVANNAYKYLIRLKQDKTETFSDSNLLDCFIDTIGYDNHEKDNNKNNKKDEEDALF